MLNRRWLLSALARLVMGWGVCTAAAVAFGPAVVMAFRDPVDSVLETLMPDFIASLSAPTVHPGNGDLLMTVHAYHSVPIAGDYSIAPWVPMETSIDAGHDLVPVALLLGVLLAWPHRRGRDALAALLLGVAACALMLVVTVALHFAGLYQINIQRAAAALHQTRTAPIYLPLFLFMESGGGWLLALLVAVAIGVLAGSRTSPRRAERGAVAWGISAPAANLPQKG